MVTSWWHHSKWVVVEIVLSALNSYTLDCGVAARWVGRSSGPGFQKGYSRVPHQPCLQLLPLHTSTFPPNSLSTPPPPSSSFSSLLPSFLTFLSCPFLPLTEVMYFTTLRFFLLFWSTSFVPRSTHWTPSLWEGWVGEWDLLYVTWLSTIVMWVVICTYYNTIFTMGGYFMSSCAFAKLWKVDQFTHVTHIRMWCAHTTHYHWSQKLKPQEKFEMVGSVSATTPHPHTHIHTHKSWSQYGTYLYLL